MTYPHATDRLAYVVRCERTGEELAAADTCRGAMNAQRTLAAEGHPATRVNYEPERSTTR